jgi:hypothetical protein
MVDVNDDMDELFRRSAEGYPLKTDTSDWKKVEQGLPVSTDKQTKSRANISRRWFLLLFLLPVGWICNNYAPKSNEEIAKTAKSLKQRQEAPIKVQEGPYQVNKDSEPYIVKKNVQVLTSSEVIAKENNKAISKEALHVRNKPRIFKNRKEPAANSVVSTPQVQGKLFGNQLDNEKSKSIATIDKSLLTNNTNDKTSAINNLNNEEANIEAKKINKHDTNVTPQADAKTFKSDEKDGKRKAYRLYAGLISNIDLSTVKFQSTRGPGLGAGILAGFQLNKRLSVESGLYLQKKFYYTDAKYFNPKNPYTAPSYQLLSVDGNCSMLETPINLKYKFITATNSAWFSVIGSSTYFMKAEKYDYTYIRNGWLNSRQITYDNSSSKWFAAVNASIGYERAVTKTGTLRVEPYFKLPVKGLGWGRLHIISTGINVGYTTKIF